MKYIISILLLVLIGCSSGYQTQMEIKDKEIQPPKVNDIVPLKVDSKPATPAAAADSNKATVVLTGQTNISSIEITAEGKPEAVKKFKEAAKDVKLEAKTETTPPPVKYTDTTTTFIGYTKEQLKDAEKDSWSAGFKWGSGTASFGFIILLVGFFLLRSKIKALLPFLPI